MPKLLKSSLAHKIYIDREGCRLGPFTLEEVNKALADGELSLSDQAWTEGMTQWVRLKEFPNVRHPFIPKLKRLLLLLLVVVGWTAGNFVIAPKIAYLIATIFTDFSPKDIAKFSNVVGGRFVFLILEIPIAYWGFRVLHMYKTDSQKRELEEKRQVEHERRYYTSFRELSRKKQIGYSIAFLLVLVGVIKIPT